MSDWAAKAKELVDAWVTQLDTQAGSWLTFDDLAQLKAAAESALREAARVPDGCVRDSNGALLTKCRTVNGSFCQPGEWAIVVAPHQVTPARFAEMMARRPVRDDSLQAAEAATSAAARGVGQ